MHRNDAFWIIVIVLFLGVFFQYNRMDGFLHLFSVANTAISSVQRSDEPWSQADTVTPDTYIVIYDPSSVESMFLRHETERMLKEKKMRFQSIRHDQPITMNMSTIRGIILSTGELEKIVSLPIMGPLSRPRSKILRVAVSRIILSSEASKVKLVGNLVA